MTQFRITSRFLIATICLLVAALAPARAQDQLITVKQWSDLVWESARRGDRGALDGYLNEIPQRANDDDVRRLREARDKHQDNVHEALANRTEARAQAQQRMHDHLAAEELSQALTAAVEVQTLSDDQRAVLDDADVSLVLRLAKIQVPSAREDGDWLYAYELLYRLNVLYEHSEDAGEYEDKLDGINWRLGLLAHYAPKRMHELRARQAERFGEEPPADFNPALTEDWRQRLRDVDFKMVRASLLKAAREHIENQGWRPLLTGGLEGLKMFANTPALAETFPSLLDAEDHREWVDFLDAQRELIDGMSERELERRGYWKCTQLLDDLVEASERTLQLPEEVIFREFGDGAMRELDEFSEIVWPDKLRRFRQSTQGSFVGVGILIRHDEKRQIMVVNPLEGSPAFFAGIKPNDRIAQVDGVSTAGWSLNDAVDKITGHKGVEVTLGIRREGVEDLVQIAIVRDVIKIRSVNGWWKTELDEHGEPKWDWMIDPHTRIAYVRLTAFNEDTYDDLKAAWRQIKRAGNPNGLILDLRYNPGGLLTSAVEVSNLFVREGVIVSGETKDREEAWPDRRAEPNKAMIARDGVPTVVLINQGSASASEIVAGCLQAHGMAVVVGKRSFGKGSVQTVHRISNEALLKLTTQYYRLPPNEDQRARGEKGDLVHKRVGAKDWGVQPDIVVNTTPQEIKAAYDLRQAADILPDDELDGQDERPDISGLLTKGFDPQLETALLILQAKALGSTPAETRHAMAN